MDQSETNKAENNKPSLLERLSTMLLREPEDREQLVSLLHSAYERNLLDADALSMMEGVIQVSEQQVHEIMIPRAQMDVIDISQPPGQFIPFVIETAHSRFPVIEGNKDNITPVRREFLSDVRAVVHLETDTETETRIRRGLAGELSAGRYGLPFLGDNQFLVDRFDLLAPDHERKAFWFEAAGDDPKPRPATTRLTVWIDRADMSRTVSRLFCPSDSPTSTPSESAWVTVGPN